MQSNACRGTRDERPGGSGPSLVKRCPPGAAAGVRVWVGALVLALFATSCAALPKRQTPTLSGSFAGRTAGGEAIVLDLVQRDGGAYGRGQLDGQPFTVSSVTRVNATAVVVFEDGSRRQAEIELSADGRYLMIRGLSATLSRRGRATAPAGGAFAGQYVARGAALLELELTQHGALIAGTGWFEGRALAVAGRVETTSEASATVLFGDNSTSTVRLRRESGGLVVIGLGGEWRLGRR